MADDVSRAKLDQLATQTRDRQPIRDDFNWLVAALPPDRERVSLHPLDPREALRALLATPRSGHQDD
jgi:hypothetical protein